MGGSTVCISVLSPQACDSVQIHACSLLGPEVGPDSPRSMLRVHLQNMVSQTAGCRCCKACTTFTQSAASCIGM